MHCNPPPSLPVELHQSILTYLYKSDLLSLRQANRYFNTLSVPYILKEIVKEIEDPDVPGLYLHKGAKNCRHDLLQSVLRFRPPLDGTDAHNETALHIAVRNNCAHCVQMLLSSGADASPMTSQCWTPLMLASRYGHAKIAAQLLEAGAAPNIKGFRGWTAMHISRRFGHEEVCSLLESAGGSWNITDNDGVKAKEVTGWAKCWGAL
ncbi:ankyrin repeat-containing domain protein [Mariannaea sp. PMI_226]|nr:ankyrin repeat-containing domain protein [Mariannaea sp. PMI_226]